MRPQITLSVLLLVCSYTTSHTTQRPTQDDEPSPFLDLASSFLQDALSNQRGDGGSSSLAGIASLVSNFMQPDANGKTNGGGGGLMAAQLLSGLSSMMNNGNGNGFDPSIIGNVIEMFSGGDAGRQKRADDDGNGNGIGLETILSFASMFANNNNNNKKRSADGIDGAGGGSDGLISLLPMVLQAVNSFSGSEGELIQAKHKDHAWVLPPFLEKIHMLWDHFSNSELARALWEKSGINSVFKGFTDPDGKLDYDKLLNSLNNQSFRRRWIKLATLYLSDWANYIAEPAVYQRYFKTAQVMLNGFLSAQGFPKEAQFDPTRPSQTISNIVDHVARIYLDTKISSITYVKPAVSYARDLFRLGKARGLLQKFNSTELSDKLTDTLNLEVIEPILKIHRAYRFATQTPHCDKYVLCELNSHDPSEEQKVSGLKPGITKFGSMAAAWFISSETGTPFWTLFGVVTEPYNCQDRYPVDCTGFHDGEAKVTTEYIHSEL